MNRLKRCIFSFFIVSLLIVGLLTIKSGSLQEKEGGFCCNNLFPQSGNNPDEQASMHCDGEPYYTDCYTCAIYWSVYVDMDNKLDEPVELCDFLPYGEDPPLLPIPMPGDFDVLLNGDHHPEIFWKHYYVHEYQIYRKIDNNNWHKIASIHVEGITSFIDSKITLPDGHTYRYKMRGKVYDLYSNFTQEKIPGARWLPKDYFEGERHSDNKEQPFDLYKNFPNPFNLATQIKYEIGAPGQVVLAINNIDGEKITTLVNEFKLPGQYFVIWDGRTVSGSRVASGLYLAVLEQGQQKKVSTLLLVK